jgi:hypothetical protein
VTLVGWGALFVAVAGGLYGFFINGLTTVIIGFIECLACGFIFIYICTSFMELFRKEKTGCFLKNQ